MMEELVQHIRRIWLVAAIAHYLLPEDVAGILFKKLAEIRLDDGIGGRAGDINGDSIGGPSR